MHKRKPFDVDAYVRRVSGSSCFICEMLAGTSDYQHVIVGETGDAVAFLNKYPTLLGYVLVAPKDHLEQVTADFTHDSYLELQTFVYRVAEGVRRVLKPERVYVLSLGSQAANSHVHWHVAPLPPGVPLEKQQFHALMAENGVIEIERSELEDLGERLRTAIG